MKNFTDIQAIYPAVNDTFVIHWVGSGVRGTKIGHYQANGLLIRSLYYGRCFESKVEMISPELALIFYSKNGKKMAI